MIRVNDANCKYDNDNDCDARNDYDDDNDCDDMMTMLK